MLLNCGVGEDSWDSLGLQADPTSPFWRLALGFLWKDWCWSWNYNTLCEELTHLKRPWCWERLRARGEGDDSGWHGWMTSPTQWIWVWVNSGSWRWTGRSGVLQFMGSQRVRHDWVTELNWIHTIIFYTTWIFVKNNLVLHIIADPRWFIQNMTNAKGSTYSNVWNWIFLLQNTIPDFNPWVKM